VVGVGFTVECWWVEPVSGGVDQLGRCSVTMWRRVLVMAGHCRLCLTVMGIKNE
jgi:hypothetical protein